MTWLGLLLLSASAWIPSLWAKDLDKAPPSFPFEGSQAVFVDIQDAHYDLRYDFAEKRVIAVSVLTFDQEQAGLPLFNFEGPARSVSVDGALTPMRFIKDPAPFAFLDRHLAAGRHVVTIESERPLQPMNEKGESKYQPILLDHFEFSDERSPRGIYLDHYLPANLAFDQYPMRFTIDATAFGFELYLHVNGVKKELARNHWEVVTPPSYNCSSLLYGLADPRGSSVAEEAVRSVDGHSIQISVLAGIKGGASGDLRRLKSILRKLEKNLAPWPYAHVVHLTYRDSGGAMEYSGGFQGGHEFHEMLHSYFARGIYPVDGNAEWFDEYVASAVAENSIGKAPRFWETTKESGTKRAVSGFSPYQQGIPVCPHTSDPILFWNKKFLKRGGIMPFLRHLASKYMYQTISMPEIKAEFEAFYQTDFTEDFDAWVLAKRPAKLGAFEFSETPEKGPHHPW